MHKILFILLIPVLLFSQNKWNEGFQRIKWDDMEEQVKDSIRARVDSVDALADFDAPLGAQVFVPKISSSKNVGAGWFVVVDSTYPEGGIAFDHPEQGKQWVRQDFLISNKINIEDYGAVPNDTSLDNGAIINNIIQDLKNIGGNVFIPQDTFYIKTTIECESNVNIIGNRCTLYYNGDQTDNSIISIKGKENIIISGLNIISNRASTSYNIYPINIQRQSIDTFSYSKNIKILNNNFKKSSEIVIWGDADTVAINIEIANNTFSDYDEVANAIYAMNDNNVFYADIHDNIFLGNSKINTAILGPGFTWSHIHDNYIEKTYDSSIYLRGNYNTIESNKVYVAGKDGIKIIASSTGDPSYYGKITNNYIVGAGKYKTDGGALININGNYHEVSNNTLIAVDTSGFAAGQVGIKVTGNYTTVTNNRIYCNNKTYNKIVMEGAITIGSDTSNVIANNSIFEYDYGIFSRVSTNIYNIIISNNSFYDGIFRAVDMVNGSHANIIISGNTFIKGNRAIKIVTADSVLIANNYAIDLSTGELPDVSGGGVTNIYEYGNFELNSNIPPRFNGLYLSDDKILFNTSGSDDYLQYDATTQRLYFYRNGVKVDSLGN